MKVGGMGSLALIISISSFSMEKLTRVLVLAKLDPGRQQKSDMIYHPEAMKCGV